MIDPELRALLSYYGFNGGTPWPIDSDGVVHLLGDGTYHRPGSGRTIRGVQWILDNLDTPLDISRERTDHSGEWCEALVVYDGGVQRQIYRPITNPEDFDMLDNGFGDRFNSSSDEMDNYIRSFPPGTWRDFMTEEPYQDHSGFRFDGWRPTAPVWGSNSGKSYSTSDFEAWNPYNGMVFFTRHFSGSSWDYRVWVPFFTYAYEPGGELINSSTLRVRWGYQPTAPWGDSPPWSEEDIGTHLTSPSPEDEPGWTIPDLPSGQHYQAVLSNWAGARVLYRRHVVEESESVLYRGTYGDFFQVVQRDSQADVIKQYEDGTEEVEGSIAVRETEFTGRSESGVFRTGENSVSSTAKFINPFIYAGWVLSASVMQFIGTNGALLTQLGREGSPYPPLALIASIPGSDSTLSWSLSAYLRRTADAMYVGVGTVSDISDSLGDVFFEDEYPLRAPGVVLWDRAIEQLSCSSLAAPSGWSWDEYYELWLASGSVTLRHTALIADNGQPHDPRRNTANAAVEEWLAVGDGLCYDGELGQLPRPRSGVTGVFLGREVDGSSDFAIDVLRLDDGSLMAVMVTPSKMVAWTREGVVWDESYEASVPPPILEMMDGTLPSLDLRFLHPDWPTPTGVVSVGGWSLIVTPRTSDHKGYRWLVGGRSVSPPFILSVGWPEEWRYPYPDPRAPLVVTYEDGGPGGVS